MCEWSRNTIEIFKHELLRKCELAEIYLVVVHFIFYDSSSFAIIAIDIKFALVAQFTFSTCMNLHFCCHLFCASLLSFLFSINVLNVYSSRCFAIIFHRFFLNTWFEWNKLFLCYKHNVSIYRHLLLAVSSSFNEF